MSHSPANGKTIDCHVHLWSVGQVQRLLDIREALGFGRMNLLSVIDPRQGSGNSTVLAAKALHGEAFYAFGALDHSADGAAEAGPLARQAERLRRGGCDGIKMLETKPTSRRELNLPVDGPAYAEYFEFVEAEQIPVLWHVADPEEFWDPATTPWWAAKHDWGYGPADVPKETLYAEVGRVLDRHPRLKVVFAHMYFLSADLPRLAEFLRRHPAVNFDLAPGVEMLLNLAKTPGQAREFFIEHQDRIFFGTDITDHLTVELAKIRAGLTRRFLETDEVFSVPKQAEELLQSPGEIRGIALPAAVLEKIYHGNFARFVGGGDPRPLDRERALDECRRQGRLASQLTGLPPEQTEAGRCIAALSG